MMHQSVIEKNGAYEILELTVEDSSPSIIYVRHWKSSQAIPHRSVHEARLTISIMERVQKVYAPVA